MNVHVKSYFRLIFCIVVVLLASSFSGRYSVAAPTSGAKPVQVSDPAYFFSASIPADWQVTRPKDPESFLRVSAISSTGNSSVSFYAFHRPGEIELEKLAGLDSKLFGNLGPVTDTRNIREYLLFTRAIEKTYDKNNRGHHALARFESHRTYAYVLLAFGSSPDFSAAKNVFDTFQVDIPLSAHWKNVFTVEGISGWIGGVVIALLGGGALYLLGKSGQFVRKGVELKKALNSAKRDAMQKGLQINNDAWHRYNRKATLFIFGPLLGWGATYSFLAVGLPLKLLLLSLAALVVPLLGYFGIFFVPSDDAADLPKGL